jgi:hypothetical protein
MDQHRAALEESLYHRVGELSAYLGRYDMYAVLLENLLIPNGKRDPAAPRSTLRTRGASIIGLLQLRRLPDKVQADFRAIDAELQVLLDRHEISARHPAPVGRQPLKPVPDVTTPAAAAAPAQPERDWYDVATADDATIEKFIAVMERDILHAVKLYIRLAAVAQDVRDVLARLH